MTTMSRAVSPALIVLAMVVMVLPTWRMEWLGPTPDSTFATWMRWSDLMILGYGNPFPLLSMLCTALALVLTLLRRGRGSGAIAPTVSLGIAVAAAVLGGILFRGLHGPGIIAPAALLLSVLLMVLPRWRARRAPSAQSRNGSSPHSGNTALRAD